MAVRRRWLVAVTVAVGLVSACQPAPSSSQAPSSVAAVPSSTSTTTTVAPTTTTTTAAPTTTTTTTTSKVTGKVVVLDPGHNGGNAAHAAQINKLVPAGRGQTKPCNTTGT